jgi:hypothetical protein
MIICNCTGISGGYYHCWNHEWGYGECLCGDECCNQGRFADDGDGHVDFMPVRNSCTCAESETLK